MSITAMSEPTWSQYLIRVGGMGAFIAVSILVTTNFFPGYEGHVVLTIAGVVLGYTFFMGWRSKNRRKGKRK